MWQLKMTNTANEWIEVGAFETVTVAESRIRELEGYLPRACSSRPMSTRCSAPTRKL